MSDPVLKVLRKVQREQFTLAAEAKTLRDQTKHTYAARLIDMIIYLLNGGEEETNDGPEHKDDHSGDRNGAGRRQTIVLRSTAANQGQRQGR